MQSNPRPLDRIASWQTIHGLTPDVIDNWYKLLKVYVIDPPYTQQSVRYIPQYTLFSEEKFVQMMEYRQAYITQLHMMLTQSLPGAVIQIRIPKNEKNTISTIAYNEYDRRSKANEYEPNDTNINLLEIVIGTSDSPLGISGTPYIYNITNPVYQNGPKIIFDTIVKLNSTMSGGRKKKRSTRNRRMKRRSTNKRRNRKQKA